MQPCFIRVHDMLLNVAQIAYVMDDGTDLTIYLANKDAVTGELFMINVLGANMIHHVRLQLQRLIV